MGSLVVGKKAGVPAVAGHTPAAPAAVQQGAVLEELFVASEAVSERFAFLCSVEEIGFLGLLEKL